MNTNPKQRLDALLRQASERIETADARLLLAHALAQPVSWLFAHGDDHVPVFAARRFDNLLAARLAGQPVAYLIGSRGFWSLDLAVTPDTLVPRPETELLVELALQRIPPASAGSVADLGTGSGAIALAIARERPRARIIATDASGAALEVARGNAASHAIVNVEFREGHWLTPLEGEKFDLIASNPPYIAVKDPHLLKGDLRFEPAMALSSGSDGLDAIREIVAGAPSCLLPAGWLLLEHGWHQGAEVQALMQHAGFMETQTLQDLESRDRVTLGSWQG